MAKIDSITVTLRIKRSPGFWAVWSVVKAAVLLRLISPGRAGKLMAGLVRVEVA